MDADKLRERAKFEDEATKNVTGPMAMSPNLLDKLVGMEDIVKERNKQKQQFFYVVLQDDTGKIVGISHYNDYDLALLKGMEKAKESYTSWSIFDLNGRFIDGNFSGTK